MAGAEQRAGRIAVVGAGLAAEAAATALSASVGAAREVVLVRTGRAPATDAFYGALLGPSAYGLHERIGLPEADLVRGSPASFAWGTRYEGWGRDERAWTQAFHQPIDPLDGVDLHQHLARLGEADLEPLLVSAQAAARGVFAHPPAADGGPGAGTPLAKAEYGYQLAPDGLAAAFRRARGGRVREHDGAGLMVETASCGIAAVTLADGARIGADLFVDASGPDAMLLSALTGARTEGRALRLAARTVPDGDLGPPCRTVRGAPFGWTAAGHTRAGRAEQVAFHPEQADEALAGRGDGWDGAEARIGARDVPWSGNCVGIGHAACVAEPLTTAPQVLLYRDLERLLELIPLGPDSAVEAREYARRFAEDTVHASLFHGAFFAGLPGPDTPYWREASAGAAHPKLETKLAQFASRGVHVPYDLEPFSKEDWLILHFGLGRRAGRYDRLTKRMEASAVRSQLAGLREAIGAITAKMPPHDRYLARYLDYLERNA